MLTIEQPYHLSAMAVHGGDEPQYSWYVNGQLRGNDTVFPATVQLHDFDTVVVSVKSSFKCAAFPEVSDTVVLGDIAEYERVNIVLDEENGPCTGDSSYITVRTLSAPAGAQLNYRFYRNGILYADMPDSVMGFGNVVRGEIFQAEAYITNQTCVLNHVGYPAITPILVTERLPIQPLGVNMDIYPHDSICLYENVHINVAAANGGATPTVIWFVNGKEVTRERTYTTDSLRDGDSVFVRIKPSADILCPDVDSADSRTLVIKVFESPTVRILQEDTVVDYGQEVRLTAEVQSSMPYTFEWLPSYDLETPNSLSSIAKPRSSHRYNFRAINELGCYSNEPGVYVEVRACPAVVARHVMVNACEGDSAVIGIHVVDFNNTAYQYTWQISTDFGETFTDIAASDPRFENRGLSLLIKHATADMDEVEGMAFRCHITSTYEFCDDVYSGPSVLRVTTAPLVDVTILGDQAECRGREMRYDAMVKGMGPTDRYNLNWYLNGELLASQVSSVRLSDAVNGDKLKVELEHTANRCVTLLHAGDSITLTVYDTPALTICPDTAVRMGDSAYLYGSMTGEVPFTYSWLPASYLYQADEEASYTRPMAYSRLFYLTGTDAHGCDTTAETLVRVTDSCLIAIDIEGPALICADSLVTYRAIVTGGLTDMDYIVTWRAEPSLNGVVNNLDAPFVTVRPNVYTTWLYATAKDVSGRTINCPSSLTDSVEIMPSELQKLTARLVQPTKGEFCEGTPIDFEVQAYTNGNPWPANARFRWFRIRESQLTDLGLGSETRTVYDALEGDRYYAFLEANHTECLLNHTAFTDTLTVHFLPVPPAFTVEQQYAYGLLMCSVDTAAIEISMDEDRSLFEYSIDSGYTFQSSPIFAPVADGDYYVAVRYVDGQCYRYGDMAVHVTIHEDSLPRLTAAPDSTYCLGETLAPLSVKATTAQAKVRWYDHDSCKTVLFEGETLNLNALNLGVGLHKFYVRQEVTNCKSEPVLTLINILDRDTLTDGYSLKASDFKPCFGDATDLYFQPYVDKGFTFNGTLTLTLTPVVNGTPDPDAAYTQTYTPDMRRVPDTISVRLTADTLVLTSVYDYTTRCYDETRRLYGRDTLTLTTFSKLRGHLIAAEQMIQVGTLADTLHGTLADGDFPAYRYRWYAYSENPDQVANAQGVLVDSVKDHAPGILEATQYYRRVVLYGTGECADTSNTVRVAVLGQLHLNPPHDTVCAGSLAELIVSDTAGLTTWYLLYSVDGTFDTTNAGLAQKVPGSDKQLPAYVADSGYYTVIGISALDGRIFYGDTACVHHQPAIGNNHIGIVGLPFGSTDTLVCEGHDVDIYGTVPTGGDGTYTFTYYSRTDLNAEFAPLPGSKTITPATDMSAAGTGADAPAAAPKATEAAAVAAEEETTALDTLFNTQSLTKNTWFIRYVESGTCASFSADTVFVEVERYRKPETGIVMTQQSCAGDPFRAAMNVAVDTGAQPRYQWYVNNEPMDGETADTLNTMAAAHGDSIRLVVYPDYSDCHCYGPDSVLSNVLVVRQSDYMAAALNMAADTVCEQETAPVSASVYTGFNLNPTYTWFVDGTQFASGTDTIAYLPSGATKGKDSVRLYMRIDAISSCNDRAISAMSDTITVYVNRVKTNTIAGDTTVCEQEPVEVTGTTATGNFDDLAYAYLYSRTAEGPWAELTVTDAETAANTAVAPGDEPVASVEGTTLRIPALADTLYIRRIAYSPERLCADTSDAVMLSPVRYRHPALGIALSDDRLCGHDNFGIKVVDTNAYLSGNSTYTWYKRNVADGIITEVGTADSIGVSDVVAGDRFWCVVTSTEGCVLPEEQTAVTDTLKITYKRNTGVKITSDTVACADAPVVLQAVSNADAADVKPVYTWEDGVTGAVRTVNVLAGEPQTYSVLITHPDYCDTMVSVTVKAHTLPDSLRLEKEYDYVCSQNSYTYRVLGKPEGLTLQWSTGETTDSIRPFIVEGDTMFTVSYRDIHGCFYPDTDTLRIEVRDA